MGTTQFERLRDYSGPVTNTDIWSDFVLRPDDVIVDTPPKCGTTWMLNIVMILIHGKPFPDAGGSHNAPWLDCAFRDRQEIKAFLDGLERRRCIKSHTPMDGIPFGDGPIYVVVYRHPVDAHFSFRKRVHNMKVDWLDFLFEGSEQDDFRRFVNAPASDAGTDDLTVASIANHFLQARKRQQNGNVHFFHYADMTRDLSGQISRLANLMSVDLSPETLAGITQATTFSTMRKVVEQSDRRFHEDSPFHDLADFYASGTSNKWEGRLTEEDMRAYSSRMSEFLSAEDIRWLENGSGR
ncbi:MAG: sulfotransferase domain-containing protein [Paracoccaceae bacterium]